MSGMERLQRMFAGAGGALGHPPPDSPTLDSSELVYISSLALLKMLKHGTAFQNPQPTYFSFGDSLFFYVNPSLNPELGFWMYLFVLNWVKKLPFSVQFVQFL